MVRRVKPPKETELQGTGLDDVFYSLDGELVDVAEPSVEHLTAAVEHDSQLQALDLALTLPLQKATLRITERKGDKGEAAWLRDHVIAPQRGKGMRTPWQRIQNQQTGGVITRRVYWELSYKRLADGKVCYDEVAWRPPQTCYVRVDKAGTVDGFTQRGIRPDGENVDIPFKKQESFVYIHRADRKPAQGETALQTAYKDYEHKQKNLRLLHIHNQNYALGTLRGKIEDDISDQNPNAQNKAKKLYQKLQRFQGGGGKIVVGQGEEVDIMNNVGASSEFLTTIQYHDSAMLRSCLLQHLALGTGTNVGTWALSRDHSDFYLMSMEAVLDDMAWAAEDDLFTPLIEWNFGKDAVFPEIGYDNLSENEEKAALDLWGRLVVAANRPQGDLWEAITEPAMNHLGIEPEKWKKSLEQDTTNPDFQRNRQLLRQAVKDGDKEVFTEQTKTNGQRK